MNDLVIIGAGDFGREVADIVERINTSAIINEWNLLGFVDDNPALTGTEIDGHPVIGTTSDLNAMSEDVYVVCSLGVAKTRKAVLSKIKNKHLKYATLIAPDAHLYNGATVGEGSIVCGGSILSINTNIGNHVIVNLNCTIGHDAIVEDYCVINPGVNISGKVIIHEQSDLGTGAKVIQGLQIGPNTIVGAGGVVVRNQPPDCVTVGVPSTKIKSISR